MSRSPTRDATPRCWLPSPPATSSCRAARELGRRREGGAAGWCWTHSASHPSEAPRLYQLCPASWPRAHRVAEHFRCPRLA
jgi:hypothetical protein